MTQEKDSMDQMVTPSKEETTKQLHIPIPPSESSPNEKKKGFFASRFTMSVTSSPGPDSTKNIWKNLMLISIGLTGVMSSYDMLRYVESTINSEKGLGTASLACIYAMNIVSALFLPSYFIQRFGCKRTFLFAVTCAFFYYVSHFYPSYYTLVPGGLFMGITFGLARTSANTFVTELAVSYTKFTDKTKEKTINLFFAIFIFISFTARIWGNLTSSFILTQEKAKPPHFDFCGSQYCWQDLKSRPLPFGRLPGSSKQIGNSDPNSPTSYQAYTLYAIAMGLGVFTWILVAIFLDNRKEPESPSGRPAMLKQALATLSLVKEFQMMLLIPITFTLGLVESYMSSDFTKAFITCSLGIHHIGFVIICYGVAAAGSSYLWGWLANKIGRISVVIIGTAINVADIWAMLLWKPDASSPVVFYVLSGVWGVADAVWRTQLFAFYGYIFFNKREAGFANFEVWESIGLVVGYVYHDFLCMTVKLYLIFAMLIFGVLCYLAVEVMLWRAKKTGNHLSTAADS